MCIVGSVSEIPQHTAFLFYLNYQSYKTMTYEELMAEAKIVYDNVAKNSPFCAQFEARKVIASKIDKCSDRDEHLDVLEWDEYKNNYAPIKRETYEQRKQMAKESYECALAEIEKEYEERGKFSPDYHKI